MEDQRWETGAMKPVAEINPYEAGTQHKPATTEPSSNSTLGLLSLICGILTMVLTLIVMGFAMFLGSNPDAPLQEDNPLAMLLGCSVFIVVGIAIIGAILGIIGLFAGGPSKKRGFAIIGLTLNILAVVGFGLCVLVGLAIA